MTIEDAKLVDVTQICRSFPDMVSPEVMRDQVVKSIDDHFEAGGAVAILKGASGLGKTVLMSQIARQHRQTCVSLFVSGANRWTYNFDVCLFDLYNQIHWLLEGVEATQDAPVDEPTFTRILLKLRNAARSKNHQYYFLLDGLDQVPGETLNTRDRLLDLMGWDYKQFKFVISAGPDASQLLGGSRKLDGIQTFPVYGFSMEEARTVLNGLDLTEEQVADIAKACRHVPRMLGRARRLLKSSVSGAEEIIGIIRSLRRGFIEMDWRAIAADSSLRMVVGHIVFDKRGRTAAQLAGITKTAPELLRTQLEALPFLRVDSGTGIVRLDNVEEKQALLEFLKPHEKEIRESIAVAMLASSIEDPDDSYYLPEVLREAGRFEELLARLSPENLGPLIDRAHSLVPIHRMTQAGLDAADRLQSVNGTLQLALCAAAIRQAIQADATEDHVAAHASLGNWEQALTIADRSRTKEEKLYYLSVILASQRDHALPADEHLLQGIRTLVSEVDTTALGPKAADIAGNIIDSMPDVAALIFRNIDQMGARPLEADWRLASVVTRRFIDSKKGESGSQSIIDKLAPHVADSHARTYLLSFRGLTSSKTAEQLLSEVAAIDNAESQVVLGRNWLKTHYRQPGASSVALKLLDLVVATAEFSPDAWLYLDLARPLPHVPDPAQREVLLNKLATQAATVERRGPTEAYVRLMALICEGVFLSDPADGVARLAALAPYVKDQQDAATRAACWASVLEIALRIEPGDASGGVTPITDEARAELKHAVDLILDQGAEHLDSLRSALRILSGYAFDLATSIASRINTQERRDKALRLIIEAARDGMVHGAEVPWPMLWKALDLVSDEEGRVQSLLGVLELLASLQCEIPSEHMQEIARRVSDVRLPYLKAKCCLKLIVYKHWSALDAGPLRHRHELLDAVRSGLALFTDDWQQIRAALAIAAELRGVDVEASDAMLSHVEDLYKQSSTANENASNAHEALAAILCRALAVLSQAGLAEEKDLDRVRLVLNRIADPLCRFDFWSRIALRLREGAMAGRAALAEMRQIWTSLVDDHRQFLLRRMPEALFLMNPADTLDRLQLITKAARDKSLLEIITWQVQKVPSSEPYEHTSGDRYRASFEDWLQVKPLVQRLESDSAIYQAAKTVGDAFGYAQNLTAQQASEVTAVLHDLMKRRLPDPDNIRHDGFLIVAEAEVLRIQHTGGKEWDLLRERACGLTNAADSVYVLTLLAEARCHVNAGWAHACVSQARERLKNIPAVADRVDRCCSAIEVGREISKELGMALAKEAWSAMGLLNPRDRGRLAKTVVDEAYRIDPEFASMLVSSMDDDPVRVKHREALRERLRVLKKADSDDLLTKPEEAGAEEMESLSEAVHMRLARLNADKEKPSTIAETHRLVLRAADSTLSEAFWLFVYHLENAARKCKAKPAEYRKHLRDLFEGVASAAEIVWRVASRPVSMTALEVVPSDHKGLHLSGDNPDAARHFVESWLLRNSCDDLIICDPYFEREDLPFVKWVLSVLPSVKRVVILGGFPKYSAGALKSPRELIADFWRDHVERNSLPPLEVCHVWTASHQRCPFHYRALVAGEAALDLDMSLNSFGSGRSSTVKELPVSAVIGIRQEVEAFLKHSRREFENERLQYEVVVL